MLSATIIVLALAEADAPEVRTNTNHVSGQHAPGHGLNDLVVERATKEWVGMGNQGQPLCTTLRWVIDCQLQPADRTIHSDALGLCVQTRPKCEAGPPALGR